MDKLIICETDRGRYAVRPMSWAGIWNEKEQIQESLNHSALFIEKEDAEKFVEWKKAEEQGKLLKLPCAFGDNVFVAMKSGEYAQAEVKDFTYFHTCGFCIVAASDKFGKCNIPFSEFRKTVFLTREEAEAALKEL